MNDLKTLFTEKIKASLNGEVLAEAEANLSLRMMNRHGLLKNSISQKRAKKGKEIVRGIFGMLTGKKPAQEVVGFLAFKTYIWANKNYEIDETNLTYFGSWHGKPLRKHETN